MVSGFKIGRQHIVQMVVLDKRVNAAERSKLVGHWRDRFTTVFDIPAAVRELKKRAVKSFQEVGKRILYRQRLTVMEIQDLVGPILQNLGSGPPHVTGGRTPQRPNMSRPQEGLADLLLDPRFLPVRI
jgi:hypothetical protein